MRISFALCAAGLVLVGAAAGASSPLWPKAREATPATGRTLRVTIWGTDPSCTTARPCGSFSQAYRAARPGDVVVVEGGTYRRDQIEVDSSKLASAPPVKFVTAPGQLVRSDGLVIYGSGITFESRNGGFFDFAWGWWARAGSSRLTFRNVRSAIFTCSSCSDLTIVGGEVGPWDSVPNGGEDPQIQRDASGTGPMPRNIRIAGAYIHDMTHRASPGAHTDCLQILAGDNIVIERNRFDRCASDAIIAKADHGDITRLLIQNNVFGKNFEAPYSVGIFHALGGCSSILRYNSFSDPTRIVSVKCRPVGTGNHVVGNVFAAPQDPWNCGELGAQWRYNVFERGPACGSRAKVLRSRDARYRDRELLDLRLRVTSGAINAGDPKAFPAYDFRMRKRPLGKKPDAGAFETR